MTLTSTEQQKNRNTATAIDQSPTPSPPTTPSSPATHPPASAFPVARRLLASSISSLHLRCLCLGDPLQEARFGTRSMPTPPSSVGVLGTRIERQSTAYISAAALAATHNQHLPVSIRSSKHPPRIFVHNLRCCAIERMCKSSDSPNLTL